MKTKQFRFDKLSVGDIIHYHFGDIHVKYRIICFKTMPDKTKGLRLQDIEHKNYIVDVEFSFLASISETLTVEKSLKIKIQKILKI